ncbi:hypothetical protein JCM3765_006864 [Sporobolomyces pararoseus]
MQFLSRFSKSKDSSSSSSKNHRRHSTPPPSSQSSTSYLPLSLPSSSLLKDESLAIPLGTTTEESLDETPSSRSVDTTPWLEVSHEVGGSPRILSSRNLAEDAGTLGGIRKLEDPAKVRQEMVKLEKGRIEANQMITIMNECGDVIRSRGLTTLGIFRPFRLPESPNRIRQLCLLFLDYNSEFDLTIPESTTRGTRASKTVKLHRFTEELRFAEIHDVVAVLKWALRQFSPPSSFALAPSPSSSSASFEFYRTYLNSTSAASYPHSSFTQFLLPLLPPTSRSLLTSTLNLIQAVASYSEINAMTGRRLCRSIGYYLFQLPSTSEARAEEGEAGWEKLYQRWKESGEILEGLLKSYLWEQQDLPPRLQELVVDYGKFVERSKTGSGDGGIGARNLRVLKIEMESRGEGWRRVGEEDEKVNDQITGYLVGGERAQFARRKPVEILVDAFEAEFVGIDETREGVSSWRMIKEKGSEEGARQVLDEEVVRILDLLGLSSDETSKPSSADSQDRPTNPRRRVTSGPLASLSEESPSNQSPSFSNFPNKSVSHLTATSRNQSRIVTPSWSDFAQTGFSNGASSLSDEFGRFDSSSPSKDLATTKRLPKRERSRVLKIEIVADLEEEFADFWLDTLFESTTTSSPASNWPSLVLAPLQPSLVSSLPLDCSSSIDRLHLLICDKLLPLVDSPSVSPPASLQRNLSRNSSKKGRSEESSLNPRKWTKRASSIFGSGGGGTSSSTRRDSQPEGVDSALSKTKKSSRRSMFVPNLPPPIPSFPRRTSADPASSPTSTSPQPYTISPTPSNDGNVLTRTISRTLQRRRSKNSISSPQSEEERQLASPPKFEAELLEPVPAIPAKYSMEVEEAKRRSQASPLSVTKSLPAEPEQPVESEEVKLSSIPLVPSSPDQILSSAPSLETPLKEVLLQGQPLLDAVLESTTPSTDQAIPLADSPTISRAAAIRTPSSEAVSLLLAGVTPPPADSVPLNNTTEESKTPETANKPLESVASPTFTLSPPGGEPEALATSHEPEMGASQESTQVEHSDPPEIIESPAVERSSSNMGLGLSNVEEPIFEPHPVVETEAELPTSPQRDSTNPTSPQRDSTNPTSPTNLAAPASPALDSAANADSPTIPPSPTPSGTSQGSSSSKKFLARTRSFLSRKKSTSALDKGREKEKVATAKAEAKREKELRKIQQNEIRNSAKKERHVPTPVSSVKKRVAELEAANVSVPSTPTTASRIRKTSIPISPTPVSPTPMPASLSQPGSAASSIVPLPSAEHNDLEGLVEETKEEEDHPEQESEISPLHPENPLSEVTQEIHKEEMEPEIGPSTVDEELTTSQEEPKTEEPPIVPSQVIEESDVQEEGQADVRVPSALGDLHSPLASPTPQSDLLERTEPLVIEEANQLEPTGLTEGESLTGVETSDVPAQEENHLSVKIPASLKDLPSPLPSPSPAPITEVHSQAILVDSNDNDAQARESETTPEEAQTVPEIVPPAAESLVEIGGEEGSQLLHHERQNTEMTVVPDESISKEEAPQTPLKNSSSEAIDPASLATPIAPSATLFASSTSPPNALTPTVPNDDPFIDSTPVKNSSQPASPPQQSPALVNSESRRSISTRNSIDTFETADAPPSTLASASSSLHDHHD